jgi:hypothetical protein
MLWLVYNGYEGWAAMPSLIQKFIKIKGLLRL